MKRLAIYLFYDSKCIVDDYIPVKLKALKEHVDTIFVVSNSTLNSEEKNKLKAFSDFYFERKNVGFDVWAYKDALDQIGQKQLDEFDEVILLNYTFFGPIYPFSEMFNWSEKNDVDFWGVSDHKEMTPNPFTGAGTLERHIQSHFIAIRRKMFTSADFLNYWQEMPMISSYIDSILNHESRFTSYFSNKGYTFDVYCNSETYTSDYPLFIEINETIKRRCPIVKRRPFFHDPIWIDKNAIDLRYTLEYISSNTDYNVDLILSNLLRTAKPKDLATNLDLLKIFDSNGEVDLRADLKVAVIAHVYYPDMIMEMMAYIENIPCNYDLFITTATYEAKAKIENQLNSITSHFLNLDVRVVEENRGRDISSLFITCNDVVLNNDYDYICRLHSKKSPQNNINQSEHFKKQMFDNLVLNRAYTSKLINFLDCNPRVGFLAPSMVHIGYPTLGHAWFTNYEGSKKLADELDIHVPFDEISPFAAYGTMFWFRPKSLIRLFTNSWHWADFNAEPNHKDSSLSHIVERLMIYAVHESGFLAYNVMSSEMAEKNYCKLEYKSQRLLKNCFNGDVQEQIHNLQAFNSKGISFNSWLRVTVNLAKSLILNHAPWLSGYLKRPYRWLLKIYKKMRTV
ncbi:Alpha-L-Rha alpha-1,2-L-rhamnosyltransferase [Photobacterium marinum]|uniref:Alpha-L-Rha alpha-1,2-L-rhamnosyltransferase n=2 Tax=Photobacterium marinum TaxID=1056511 RepID=L8JCE6_9GAMM|nr:Alpha-L-Rha alpha-1,2-L-rhamnosyltransferase [Photobacterium marinum]